MTTQKNSGQNLAATGIAQDGAVQPAPVLVLRDVSRFYADGNNTVAALKDVSLELYPGQMVAIMGPSGSGKSTLLHVAGGLDQPSQGSVVVAGTELVGADAATTARVRRQQVGFVFQNYNLVDTLTIAENVALPLELEGVRPADAQQQALEALTRCGIGELADRFPAAVSGGQRQRAAIARALVGNRQVILADEPTGALDSSTAEQVMQVIREATANGAAALVVTHEPRLAAYADTVWSLRDGQLNTTSGGGRRV